MPSSHPCPRRCRRRQSRGGGWTCLSHRWSPLWRPGGPGQQTRQSEQTSWRRILTSRWDLGSTWLTKLAAAAMLQGRRTPRWQLRSGHKVTLVTFRLLMQNPQSLLRCLALHWSDAHCLCRLQGPKVTAPSQGVPLLCGILFWAAFCASFKSAYRLTGNALVWEGELPPVYTWRASGLEAGASRLMLRPVAGGRRLALAEVQVHAVVPWECERCIAWRLFPHQLSVADSRSS